MKLSVDFLLQSLKSKEYFFEYQKNSEDFSVDRPVFYQSGMLPENNKIYILYDAFPDAVNFCPSYCIFICLKKHMKKCSIAEEDLWIFPNNTSLLQLFNDIQLFFDSFEQWDEKLHELQTSDGSIHQMLEVSYPIFQNPILVQNLDFTTIASCNIPETSVSGPSLAAYRDMEFINVMKQDPFFNKVREWDDVFLFPDHVTGFRSLNYNIKKYDHTAFRIIIPEYTTPFRSYHKTFLKHLGTYISYALLHNAMQRSSQDKTLRNILINLLSNKNADYMTVSDQLTNAGWFPTHTYVCLTFRITFLDVQNLTVNSICDYVENIVPGSCAFSFKKNIVAFANLDLFDGTIDDISEKLIYFIRDSFLKLSFSNPVKGHMHLRRQYLQASAAQEIGSIRTPYSWVHYFSKLALPYIFRQATSQLPGNMLCHEGLLRLLEYDKEKGTEYTKTLETYLKKHLNAVQSARELFIHRSTFLYRLEKICSILESNLTDYDELVYLMISFYLLRDEHLYPLQS